MDLTYSYNSFISEVTGPQISKPVIYTTIYTMRYASMAPRTAPRRRSRPPRIGISLIFLTAFPNVAVPEINGGVHLTALEKRAEHVHVERFAETAGTGEKRYHRNFIQKITDHQRFVDIVVFGGSFSVV